MYLFSWNETTGDFDNDLGVLTSGTTTEKWGAACADFPVGEGENRDKCSACQSLGKELFMEMILISVDMLDLVETSCKVIIKTKHELTFFFILILVINGGGEEDSCADFSWAKTMTSVPIFSRWGKNYLWK